MTTTLSLPHAALVMLEAQVLVALAGALGSWPAAFAAASAARP